MHVGIVPFKYLFYDKYVMSYIINNIGSMYKFLGTWPCHTMRANPSRV